MKWENQDPAYQYRWVNDNEDRIPRFKDAGWQVVESDEHAAGYRTTGDPTALATSVEKSVGAGTKAVLMRIDKEWYKEDQKTKQEEVDEIEPEDEYFFVETKKELMEYLSENNPSKC